MHITTQDVNRVLTKLDADVHVDGDNRFAYVIDENGERLYPPIFVSMQQPLSPPLVERLRRAFGVTVDEFSELFACTMNKQSYLRSRKFGQV